MYDWIGLVASSVVDLSFFASSYIIIIIINDNPMNGQTTLLFIWSIIRCNDDDQNIYIWKKRRGYHYQHQHHHQMMMVSAEQWRKKTRMKKGYISANHKHKPMVIIHFAFHSWKKFWQIFIHLRKLENIFCLYVNENKTKQKKISSSS